MIITIVMATTCVERPSLCCMVNMMTMMTIIMIMIMLGDDD